MIYFITNGKYVNISRSSESEEDILERLQPGSATVLHVIRTLSGDIDLETKCHFCFNPYRILGNWYDLPQEYLKVTEKKIKDMYTKMSVGSKKVFNAQVKNTLPQGMVYVNSQVAATCGLAKAVILDALFLKRPHNNDNRFKVNISGLAATLPVSLSTANRCVKELVEEEQYLVKHSRSVYSFSPRFFDTFEEYNQNTVL